MLVSHETHEGTSLYGKELPPAPRIWHRDEMPVWDNIPPTFFVGAAAASLPGW